MHIKILGTGCPKCKKLLQLTEDTVKETGIDAKIDKVEDINDIMEYGVMVTPALVIDEKVVFSGKIPKKEELKNILT